jgi:hypothetical protein
MNEILKEISQATCGILVILVANWIWSKIGGENNKY